ncbi:NAD(P)H-binding protein [Mycobacterium sp. 1081908.1]|uniref:NAD(P)H-binding protein n=1 Tax=Mycobacterium sp. 1081908.1 TaxID=1834066 RepID=UPI0007FC43CC|nr:NAD(P)H-binding protein [Mycobacterium sp. 1081908.1]OBK53589.1 hypothetical protein A5655_19180 [Mycobacterium sp. 1081908.1]
MGDTILVTGATGTVGREVVDQLLDAGHRVRVLVRAPERAQPGTEAAVADLNQPQTLTPAFDGARKAFILAPPVPEIETMTVNALVAAEQARVEHIVYLSNFGAGRFEGALFDAHGANEWRLRSLRSTWTILRPTRFMNYVPFAMNAARDSGRLVETYGGAKVVMIDPVDIGAVTVECLTAPGHDGKVYILSGQALTGDEIAAHVSDALGTPVDFVDAGLDETRQTLLASGFPAALAEHTLAYFETVRSGQWYETTTVADILGRPARTYQDWLADHASDFT